MKIKKGVALAGMSPTLAIATQIVEPILAKYGQELVITSCMDGKHKRSSAHYTGMAIDLRIWDITDADRCVEEMQYNLGKNYDVLLENDHIHLEFDPEQGA